jgi:hypothetical protein
MSRKVEIAFIAFFCFCIFSIGIVQAIWEKANGETIQMLDIVEDTFATPLKRANTLHELFSGLDARCDAVASELGKASAEDYDWGDAMTAAEELMFAVGDIRKNVLAINRHVQQQESAPPMVEADSLRRTANRLYDACKDEELETAHDLLAQVRSYASAVAVRYPRRTLTSVPRLAWNAFWHHTGFSQKYLRAWENEMEETSLAADRLRPPNQFVRFATMHDLGEKAVLGRNGWYFYRPGVEYLTYPSVLDKRSQRDTTTNIIDASPVILKDDPIRAIVHFRDQLARYGIDLLVVIVPGKASIYPDMLNTRYRPGDAGLLSHSLQVIDRLQDEGVGVVDLFRAFGEERLRDAEAGDSLYLSKDTHWRARGLRLCARLVAERIRQYPWYDQGWETTEYVLDSVVVNRVGDVGTMTTLPDFRVRDIALSFNIEPTKCYQVFQVRRNEEGEEVSRVLYRDDYNRSQIMVLGDSFSRIYQTDDPRSAGWIAHLAYELSQPVASFVSDGGASTLVRQTLARRLAEAREEGKRPVLAGKKLVVWEFIERDLRFGAEGWQHVVIDM